VYRRTMSKQNYVTGPKRRGKCVQRAMSNQADCTVQSKWRMCTGSRNERMAGVLLPPALRFTALYEGGGRQDTSVQGTWSKAICWHTKIPDNEKTSFGKKLRRDGRA
jgi:hypothetical protein